MGGGIAGERTCLQGLSSYRMIITADMLSICTYILGRKWRPLVPVSLSRLVSGTCSGFPPGHQHASADFGLARPHNGGIPRRRPSPAHGKPLDARAVWFSSGSRGGRRVVVPAGRVLVEMGGGGGGCTWERQGHPFFCVWARNARRPWPVQDEMWPEGFCTGGGAMHGNRISVRWGREGQLCAIRAHIYSAFRTVLLGTFGASPAEPFIFMFMFTFIFVFILFYFIFPRAVAGCGRR